MESHELTPNPEITLIASTLLELPMLEDHMQTSTTNTNTVNTSRITVFGLLQHLESSTKH
jgi:hypothetical protein